MARTIKKCAEFCSFADEYWISWIEFCSTWQRTQVHGDDLGDAVRDGAVGPRLINDGEVVVERGRAARQRQEGHGPPQPRRVEGILQELVFIVNVAISKY